jgi:hypothetical protein
VIRREVPGRPGLVLFGVVRGLVRDAEELTVGLDALAPAAVALGLADEERRALEEHFVGTSSEPLVPLLESEYGEIRALARFGEVRVPQPGFVAALEWARTHGVPAKAVDPDEERYADMFGEHVGYTELLRRTLRERRLLRSPPRAKDADELIERWDGTLNGGRGSRALQSERDQATSAELLRRHAEVGRLAAVIDRERVERVAAALANSSGAG